MLAERIKIVTQRLGVALTTSVLLSGAIVDARAATQGIIGTAFESTADYTSCGAATVCIVYFTAVPAGKVIKVDHAICNVTAAGPLLKAYFGSYPAFLSRSPVKSVAMEVETVSTFPTVHRLNITLDTPMFVGAGRTPGVTVLQSTNGLVVLEDCAISGTVISG